MPYVVEDVISADIAEESSVKLADIERYAATTTLPPEEQQHLIFVVLLFVSGALNIIHLYSLIFSTRMKIDARRWHAIYCCLVNFMLLWCYANFTKNQPFYDFSPNIYWKSHADPLQMVPFSAFPASLCLLILISMVTFISKRLKSLFVFKWLLSFIFYVALIYAQYALVTSYYDSINEADLKIQTGHPILHFHYYTCMCAAFLWLVLLAFAIFATLYYGIKAVTSRRKVVGNRLKDVYSLYGVLLYSTAVMWCHLPKESVLLGRYMQEVFIPMHPQQIELWKLKLASKISSSPVLAAFVGAIPITNGLIPTVEYLAGCISFTSFRESLLQFLSCGTFYPTSSEGSIWNICKRLNRIRTASATVSKKENNSSVHAIVMDTKIKTDIEIIT